jgi:hypothetical protein
MVLSKRQQLEQFIAKKQAEGVKIDWAVKMPKGGKENERDTKLYA